MEVGFVFGELADARPAALRRRPHDPEDLLELVFVRRAGEQGPSRVHFSHDAAGGPDVDAGVVGSRAEEDVGSAVPEGDDLVGEGVDRNAECSGQTEIRELELALVVDEEILGFQVSMEHPIFMAKGDTLEELVHEGFYGDVVQLAAGTAGVHVFFQVLVHIFEDEHELILGVYDVV